MDLDDLATRDAVAADPGLFVEGATPVLIDEFQHVPAVLGRFVLTGSTPYDSLPLAAQSLTGGCTS